MVNMGVLAPQDDVLLMREHGDSEDVASDSGRLLASICLALRD